MSAAHSRAINSMMPTMWQRSLATAQQEAAANPD